MTGQVGGRTTLVDSSVLLDVLTDDPRWAGWSTDALACADDAVSESEILREPLPWEAGFLAGKAFLAYRRRGGTRRSPLPDFYIGAHAAVRRHRLLTRDAARYRTYFPTVDVIAP